MRLTISKLSIFGIMTSATSTSGVLVKNILMPSSPLFAVVMENPCDSSVLFLDEPTTGVDAVSRSEFWDMLAGLNQKGITILVSIPYIDEASRCNRIALCNEGRILGIDTPDDIVGRFDAPLYAVWAANMYSLLLAARRVEGVAECYPFGEVHHLVYGLVPVGNIGVIYLGAMLFILTISGLSLTIANFSETMQQTMFVMFFFIMIFMLMSGSLTPVSSMPEWAQKLTVVLPPRYFVEMLRSVYLKGITFAELYGEFMALGIFALLFNSLAAVTYRKQA